MSQKEVLLAPEVTPDKRTFDVKLMNEQLDKCHREVRYVVYQMLVKLCAHNSGVYVHKSLI